MQWTESGTKRRKFFTNQAKAIKWIRERELSIARQGREIALKASEELIRDAVELQDRLQEHGVCLREAVEYYIEVQESVGRSKPLKMVKELFLDLKRKENRSIRTLDEYESRLNRIVGHFGTETKASAVTTSLFEDFLDGIKGSTTTRNHYRRVGHTLFAWAAKRGFCPSNPVASISRARVDRDLPGIFTAGQMKTMLELASNNAHLTAWVSIGAYAGLRPSEIQRLTWDRIHLDSGQIDVTAVQNKAGRRRLVDIRPKLRSILHPIQQVGGAVVPDGFE